MRRLRLGPLDAWNVCNSQTFCVTLLRFCAISLPCIHFFYSKRLTIFFFYVFYQAAGKPTLAALSDAFTKSLKEGRFYFLRLTSHGVDVFKSMRPANISCRQEDEGDHILCSAFNVDVTFNILHLVN